jgi:hypothetical protein
MRRRVVILVALSCLAGSCAAGTPGHETVPGATTPAPAAVPVVSAGPGWSPAGGLEGPVPAPGTCRAAVSATGAPLPDPSCTPGAIDAAVTQDNLSVTLCRPGGYTASVRPPERLTRPFKAAALRAYAERGSMSGYELDHLVPLEVGGSSDTRNLWPEPDDRPSAGVANSKDPVESRLHALVCAAVTGGPYLPLATAQRLIAADWSTALARARAALVGETA